MGPLLIAVLAGAEPAPEPTTWSVGAGISTTIFRGGVVWGFVAPSLALPAGTLTFERRLGEKTWLMLGLTGILQSTTYQPEKPTAADVVTNYAQQTVLLSLGLQHNLLSSAAPVAVFVHAILSFGYQRQVQSNSTRTMTPLGPPVTETMASIGNGGVVGLGAGLAVERMLIESLAVRLTLGLIQGSFGAGRVQGAPNVTAESY